MQRLKAILAAKLALVGVVAAVQYIPGEGGGFIVRVSRLADTFPAEDVAAAVQKDFGVEVVVAF